MKAILTDVGRCIGCQRCVTACVRENRLGEDRPFKWRNQDGLSADRFTSVLRRDGLHVRKQCRHCLEPACVSACPVGALSRTEEGAVVYDRGKCLGCRYCMMACPFGIPRYSWSEAVPSVRKCTFCHASRLSAGKQPACTEACPTGATVFGDRQDLLAEARNRLRADPARYLPRVFGEKEVGGTAVLYLSPINLDFLALGNRLDDRPLPERTRLAMSAVPFAFVGMGVLAGGLYWIIDRRMRLAEERTGEATVQALSKPAAKSPVKPSAPAGPARMVLPVPDEPDRGRKPVLRDESAAVVNRPPIRPERLPGEATVPAPDEPGRGNEPVLRDESAASDGHPPSRGNSSGEKPPGEQDE